jgi:hypothetical protein
LGEVEDERMNKQGAGIIGGEEEEESEEEEDKNVSSNYFYSIHFLIVYVYSKSWISQRKI